MLLLLVLSSQAQARTPQKIAEHPTRLTLRGPAAGLRGDRYQEPAVDEADLRHWTNIGYLLGKSDRNADRLHVAKHDIVENCYV